MNRFICPHTDGVSEGNSAPPPFILMMNSRGEETRDGGVKDGEILLDRRGLNGIRKECVTGKVQVRQVRGERDETRVFM